MTFTVAVATGDGQTSSVELTVTTTDPVLITTAGLPTGVVGAPYSTTLAATGGDGVFTWSLISGSLPDGLTFDPSGLLAGTPTTAVGPQLTIQVSTGDGQTITADLTLDVYEAISIGTDSLPTGVVGASYSQTLAATGGDGTFTWSVVTGALPNALGLDPSGLISGTPTGVVGAPLTFQAATGDGQTATVDLTLTIYGALSISTTSLPEAEVGQAYSAALSATGGDGTFTWSLISGSLPANLTLDPMGPIDGTPTVAEGAFFTAQVASGDGQTATVGLDLKSWVPATFVEGYAGATSVDRGETIELRTSTDGSEHSMRVYRMGWYGGAGRALMLTVDSVPGLTQAVPAPDADGLIEANWSTTYTLQTDPSWTSGVYIIELDGRPSAFGRIQFVLRDDANPADLLVQIPVTTYQAYNSWGGKSLYEYNSTGGRAYKVSFDRPYVASPTEGDGTGGFFQGDNNLIRWIEREGYQATYVTSVDLERDPSVFAGQKVFISNFHDEYWSRTMRERLVAAQNTGLHSAFLDSNNMYWQIRFESSSGGQANRVVVGYKDAILDPMGATNLATVRWRDAPVNEPENAVLGVMYESDFAYGSSFPWVVQNSSHWIYDGTGLNDLDEIDGLVGYEYDRVWANGSSPAGLTILAASPVVDGLNQPGTHNAAIFTLPSTAIVFSAGTNYWSWMLDEDPFKPVGEDARVQQMMRNLLTQMLM